MGMRPAELWATQLFKDMTTWTITTIPAAIAFPLVSGADGFLQVGSFFISQLRWRCCSSKRPASAVTRFDGTCCRTGAWRWRCLPSCLRSASRCTPGRTAGRFSKTTPRRPGKRFFLFCHSLRSSLLLLPSSLADADRAGYRVAAPVRCLLLCPRLPGCLTVACWPANAARDGHDAAILPHVWCSPSLLVTASKIVVCSE